MASPTRRPGSDRGRPAIDWEQAFAHYAALPPERRCYEAVAVEFGVSVRTVEKHGRRERWRERLRGIEAQAAAELDKTLGQARAKQLADVEKLIEASFVLYAQQLRNGDVQIKATDLPRLVKLLLELWEEPGEAAAAPVEAVPLVEDPLSERRSLERKLEVMRALHESGALGAPYGDEAEANGGVEREPEA
jgi:hypothetical protein